MAPGGSTLEEGRVLDVGGGGVPRVELTLGGRQVVPIGVASRDAAVHLLQNIRDKEDPDQSNA